MTHTDGRPTIAMRESDLLPPPITDGRDPGDEQPEIPMRCPTCDRYCGGRCPTAIHKEKS